MASCDGPSAEEGRDYGDITGVEEIAQPLSPFSSTAWDAGAGSLVLTFDNSETMLVVSKHVVSGAILVNDVPTLATGTTLKKLFINGAAASETVILDFANGSFAPGVTGVNGQGITVAMAGGTDVFKVRGSGIAADVVTLGGAPLASTIAFNVDAFPDITVAGTGTVAYTFSLGGGNDVFNATTTQYGVTGPFLAGTAVATGSVTAVTDVANAQDTLTFTLSDGLHTPTVFELDSTGAAGVTAGNVAVVYTTADTAATIATAIRTAINAAPNLDITAAAPVAGLVGLTNDTMGAFGNVTISGTLVTKAGMAGGVGGGGATGVTVYGGLGDDTLTGSNGNDSLYGDLGTDILSGGNSPLDSDVLSGGASFADGGGLDTVTYAARSASVFITVGAVANDGEATETDNINVDVETVIGGTGADTFTGYTGVQTFKGGAGNDTFLMGVSSDPTSNGADVIWGEAGTDTVSYADRTVAIVAIMDGLVGDGEASENDNIQADVENFICPTGIYACTVTGNASDNTFTCGGGLDKLTGGAGDDTFVIGATGGVGDGADEFTGGTGIDTVNFSAFGAVVNLKMDFTASTTQSKKINTDVENVVLPNQINTLVCNAADNHVFGGTAADTIDSAGGDDFVEGGGGADVITCGDGSDVWTGRSTGSNTAADCEL